MKTARFRGNFVKPLKIALEMAGYEFARRGKNAHRIYKRPGSPTIVVPPLIDDPKIFYQLRKLIELIP